MLLYFAVKNFGPFKEEAKLSLIASAYDKEDKETDNVFEVRKFGLRVLKSAVIYGANASGKSKLIEALMFMKSFVENSSKDGQKGEAIKVDPFRLNSETELEPSLFEVAFVHEGEFFKYGFEATSKVVVSEWLTHRPNTKEVEIFDRQEQDFELHSKFKVGKTLIDGKMVRNNALMLSVATQFNDVICGKVLSWFENIGIISGIKEEFYHGFSMKQAFEKTGKEAALALMKAADLGIDDIVVKRMSLEELPKDLPHEIRELLEEKIKDKDTHLLSDVKTLHRKYDADGQFVSHEQFSLNEDESEGTKKFFALTGPVLDSLEKGHMMVVDELDAKLHPNLVAHIVKLFNSQTHNPNNAQLVFNTHSVSLLDKGKFRRDQIWFTSKDFYGAGTLYPLSDYKKDVRKEDSYEKKYLEGRFGAVPFLQEVAVPYKSAKTHETL